MGIEISIATHGAELQSLKRDGREYLWHGDAKYWGRRSPILFPMVGKVYGNVFRVEGKEYPMGQHGFARDSEFVKDGDRYVLSGCPLEKYPYKFELAVRYRTEGNRFYADWTVTNKDSKDIHFQIGAHPALLLPDYHEEDPIHGYLQCFNGNGSVVKQPMLKHGLAGGYLTELEAPIPMPVDEDGLLPITGETFAIDTFMLEHGSVKSVTLLTRTSSPTCAWAATRPRLTASGPPTSPAAPSSASSPGAVSPTSAASPATSPPAT